MLTQLVRDTGTNTTPVFTLYVHNVIVLQWEKKMVKQIYTGPTHPQLQECNVKSSLNKTRM